MDSFQIAHEHVTFLRTASEWGLGLCLQSPPKVKKILKALISQNNPFMNKIQDGSNFPNSIEELKNNLNFL